MKFQYVGDGKERTSLDISNGNIEPSKTTVFGYNFELGGKPVLVHEPQFISIFLGMAGFKAVRDDTKYIDNKNDDSEEEIVISTNNDIDTGEPSQPNIRINIINSSRDEALSLLEIKNYKDMMKFIRANHLANNMLTKEEAIKMLQDFISNPKS